jgi:hypothetical protein
MLRLDKIIKPWKESAALNAHINLYGFWNETAFLTKSGDLGMILSVPGVDYESLDRSQQEYAVKRLEAALKGFGPGFHVYQYLFKSNRPDIPFATYDDPIVEAAIDQRRKFFEAKRDHLYQVEIFYCILLEGARSKTGVGTALVRLLRDPEGAIAELKSQFTNDSMKKLLRTHIERDLQRLGVQEALASAHGGAGFSMGRFLNLFMLLTFAYAMVNYYDTSIPGLGFSIKGFIDGGTINLMNVIGSDGSTTMLKRDPLGILENRTIDAEQRHVSVLRHCVFCRAVSFSHAGRNHFRDPCLRRDCGHDHWIARADLHPIPRRRQTRLVVLGVAQGVPRI